MGRHQQLILIRRLLLFCLLSTLLAGQTLVYSATPYTLLDQVSASGAGPAFHLQGNVATYTWTVVTASTITTATVNLEGSVDGSHWFVLDQAVNTDVNWLNGEMRHVVNKPVNFLREDVIAITGGGSLTGTFTLFR